MKLSILRYLSTLAALITSALTASELQANPGDLYSGQESFLRVDKFTPGGARSTFVSGFFADALAFDSQGNLFVADTQVGKIIKVTPAGVSTTFATVSTPMGLAFDASGNLYVSSAGTGAAGSGSIIKITPAGVASTFASGLSGPFGLAFDRAGNLFVSQTSNGSILEFAPNGASTTFALGLATPEGIAFDTAGNLYEADFSSGTIFKFSPTGVKSVFGTAKSGAASLGPRNLAVDQAGNVFVAVSVSQQILKFTSSGGTGSVFASTGNGPGQQPANPGGLAFEPLPAALSILSNLSTRALVETGDKVLIGGFVINGTVSKQVLVRAIGPSLAGQGVAGSLQDPTVGLFQGSAQIASNDNWQSASNASLIPVALRPQDPRESAILISLAPGNYTAIVSGKSGTSGVGLVEIYDLSPSASSQLTNVSTRGTVQTGDDVMIGGFVSAGNAGTIKVLVRAIGPSLSQFGLTGVLADPTLRVFDSQGMVIASNDNWKDTDQAAIQATGHAPISDLESAVLLTLAPGGYTGIVSGKNGGTGLGQVEIFKIQ